MLRSLNSPPLPGGARRPWPCTHRGRREGGLARSRARRRLRLDAGDDDPYFEDPGSRVPEWDPIGSTARSVGWSDISDRTTTPDSWDRDGQPHEHWDDLSDPPMLCWHRFDLIDSTYAVAMMADIAAAWREVYPRILDELIFRHTGWSAARDWLTQIGHDPDRAELTPTSAVCSSPSTWGSYDVPG